jgi:IS5 family transposase
VESGQRAPFRARLDQIIALDHTLVRLARTIDFLEQSFGAVYTDTPVVRRCRRG